MIKGILNTVLRILLFAAGLLLIGDFLLLSSMVNIHFGMIVVFAAGLFCLSVSVFYDVIQRYTQGGFMKWLKYAVAAMLCCAVLSCVLLAAYGANDNADYTEDAVIVLGAGLKGDVVTNTLAYRLNTAAEYAGKNTDAVIVVSGGQGYGESITEAEAMKKYLVKKGVPEDRIIEEPEATSTYENFLYSKEILDGMFGDDYRAVFVTNGFHIFRSGLVAKHMGMQATHMHAYTQWYDAIVNYAREIFAIAKYLVLRS